MVGKQDSVVLIQADDRVVHIVDEHLYAFFLEEQFGHRAVVVLFQLFGHGV